MTEAFVGLGSNMSTWRGDAAAQLAAAVQALGQRAGLTVAALSPLYWTEPQDKEDQPWFANQVLKLACGPQWTAPLLLQELLGLEAELGRVRGGDAASRFGPRVIDLDLLLFGRERREDAFCTLPHPRMMQRAFVLVPLRDVAPEVILQDGMNADTALRALPHRVQGQNIYQQCGVR